MYIKIVGSGSYIPELIIPNSNFSDHIFLDNKGEKLKLPETIIGKFKDITGIGERR